MHHRNHGRKPDAPAEAIVSIAGGLEQGVYGDTVFGDFMKRYFYGENKSGPYFEGWYFKCQTREGHALAVIPAIHICEDGQKSASIQVITENGAWWQEYPASSFSASGDALNIRLGENSFSETGMILEIEQEGLSLHGRLSFGAFQCLKSDIMGPFRWLANMECAHSVISMEHTLDGRLELNGNRMDFCGGTGYVEADRGRSFPVEYLWTQCMWKKSSLMLSVATIPLGRIRFTGCICAIILNGREYRIATYRGAVIQNWSPYGATLKQGRYRLEIQLLKQDAQLLHAPSDGNMNRSVQESLCAKVRYRFWRDSVLLLDHTSERAAYEYAKS